MNFLHFISSHILQEQQGICEQLNRTLSSEKQTAAAAQQRAIDAEACVTALQKRLHTLQVELRELRSSCVPASVVCVHAQTDANLLEPLTAEV